MLNSNLSLQHVFIVGDGSILNEGVKQILTQETDMHVSSATYTDDHAFLNTIELDRPDVFLLCESDSLDPNRIVVLVSALLAAMELLIVVVRLHNNMIDVYARPASFVGVLSYKPRRIIARTGNDLVNALRRKANE